MAFQRPFLISLRREDSREPWGFRLDGGGVTSRPVTVQQVLERSLAERSGLHEGDQVIQIGRINVQNRTLSEVQELIISCKNRVEMFIIREDLLRNRKENEPLTVKAVVHSPYNSPFQLYSPDNVADTLATQACILTDPNVQPTYLGPKSPPTVIHSNVLEALREQGERGPRLNGEIRTTPPVKKKQPPPVPPKPRPPSGYPLSPPVKAGIFPGNMEQVQYQNYSTVHREEQRTTTQKTSNYEEYEEEEEEETEEEEEETPVVVTQKTTTFKSQTSFTPQQSEQQRSQQQTQHIVRTQQTVQQETRQRELQQQQQEQQRKAEIARQQQQAYEQQQRQLREQQQRQAYEQQQRQIREQQAREQQIREQQAREQQLREQQAREQRAREQQAREQQAREQQSRDQQQRLAAQQRQAYEQQQAREAYERQQRQAYEQQQRQAQWRPQPGQQQQRPAQQYETESQKKLTSTSRVVPANLGSPVTQRRGGNCPAWPPKNSSVREMPKTGFSPSFVQERGSKQFVWPPPRPEDLISQDAGWSPHVTGHAGDAWHPQETPSVSRPLVPRSPTPTRRMGDSVWPPRHTLIDENAVDTRPMPRPVCRRGKFDEYITSTASSNVPPTYRVPPGTVHVNIVY